METITTTRWEVAQFFDSLGDSCSETFQSIDAANTASEVLRNEIAEMVSCWPVTPAPSDGNANEIETWVVANEMAETKNRVTYGNVIGRYIAENAVLVWEI